MLLNIQSSKKKDIIELQIAMRKLKLEKTDLHMQNLEIKRQILLSRNDQESKDEEMRALLSEVQRMREEMQMKEDQLAQSKEELRRKDAYISKI
jgi:predicted  nucleic acid-binding Zn-ribbon protein